VGGWFSNFNGVNSGGVVRLLSNGTVDTSFNPESGGHSTTALALQPDGRVIVAGDFIERLNSDGTLDRNFRGRVDEFVQAIVLQADGKIVLGGQFHQIDGSPERPYFARLNADGTLDLSFNPAVQLYPPGIWSLALESSGTILAGAYFDAVDGVGLRKLIRLNPADGSINDTFNENRGISGPVYSAGVQADGKVLIAGFFGDVNNKRRQGIARLESNGRLDETFDPGLILNQAFYSSSNVVVYSLVVQGDGKVIIGGGFTNINGIGRNNIARLNSDGSVDETFNPGEGTDYSVYRVVLQPDGRVLISGGFNHADGTALPYFARLNADGSLDRSFQPNLGFPYAMAVEPEGQIVVAGYRITNSTAVVFVVRLNPDGSIDPGFNVGPIGGYAVNSVGVQPDGRILVGGSFNSIGGINRTNIARLNDDGSVDLSFDPGSAVQGTTANLLGSFLLQPDGKILVGATATDGVENVNVILRLNPDGTVDDSFVSLPGGWLPLALQPDARIIAGGTFSAADGTVRMWVARLFGAPPLVITVEPDDLSVKVGDTAIFHVVASGTPVLHYQWYFNGTPITDGPQISGATTATLTLKRAHFRDEGEYKVVISNDEGSVTSRTVSLRVHPGGKA
jgi:uncharacterized delta-60 repeat protein